MVNFPEKFNLLRREGAKMKKKGLTSFFSIIGPEEKNQKEGPDMMSASEGGGVSRKSEHRE